MQPAVCRVASFEVSNLTTCDCLVSDTECQEPITGLLNNSLHYLMILASLKHKMNLSQDSLVNVILNKKAEGIR